MIRFVLVLAISTGLSVPSLAAADPCRGTTTPEMNACAVKDLKASDAELNRTYQTLMGKIGPRSQQALRAAREAWLTFRDKSCALEILGSEGGSVQRFVELTCLKQGDRRTGERVVLVPDLRGRRLRLRRTR